MRIKRLLALVAIVLIGLTPALVASPASADASSDFAGSINSLRAGKGLPALRSDARLNSIAQDWANQMAAANKISHRPNLGGAVSGWSKIGENVGVGGDVGSVFGAFTNSAGHYRNMVDGSFDSIGVGVAMSADGRMFTAHNFAQFGSGAPAAAAPASKAVPAPAAAPAPAPKPAVRTRAAAPAPAPKAAPVAIEAPAPVEAPAPAPAPEPVAPPKPQPSQRIAQSIAEVGSIATQG